MCSMRSGARPTNMTTPSTRRDARFRLRPRSSVVEFADLGGSGTVIVGQVESVNAAGLGFLIDTEMGDFPPGTALDDLTLRIGHCTLRGEAVVRNLRVVGPEWILVGCLFYPAVDDEDRWMSLIAGLMVADSSGGDSA